jgi:DNA polymerase-3 subunit delta
MAAAAKGGISYEDIIRSVRDGEVKPVYLLMGAEDYYIDKLSDFLAETLLQPDERDFNLDILYGQEATADKVVELARAYPMMADRRVVLVREAQAMRSLDALDAYLEHLTPTTVLILCYKHGTLDKRKAVAKLIEQNGVVFESKRLYDSQLPQFITQYFSRKKVKIEMQAVQMLAGHVGADLCRLSAEMDKLLLSLSENEDCVTASRVEELTGMSKEFNDFELRSALAVKDIFKSMQIVKYYQGQQQKFALPQTLSNLFTFFSAVLLTYYAPDKSDRGIAGWLGMPEWQARKDIIPAYQNYKAMKVLQILSEIRKTDAKGKGVGGGKTPKEELLQELIFFILH